MNTSSFLKGDTVMSSISSSPDSSTTGDAREVLILVLSVPVRSKDRPHNEQKLFESVSAMVYAYSGVIYGEENRRNRK